MRRKDEDVRTMASAFVGLIFWKQFRGQVEKIMRIIPVSIMPLVVYTAVRKIESVFVRCGEIEGVRETSMYMITTRVGYDCREGFFWQYDEQMYNSKTVPIQYFWLDVEKILDWSVNMLQQINEKFGKKLGERIYKEIIQEKVR